MFRNEIKLILFPFTFQGSRKIALNFFLSFFVMVQQKELVSSLTVYIPIICHGVDLLVGQDLHMLAAGPAVQLVYPDQPAAHAVRHFALLAYMLREIRRGLIGYLSEIRYHHNHQYMYIYCYYLFVYLLTFADIKLTRKQKNQDWSTESIVCPVVTVGNDLST